RQRLVRVEEHAQGLNGRRRDVERGGEHDRVIGAHPTRAHGAALMEDYIWIIWVVLGVVLMVAELFTPGFVLLWFGIGAIAAALMSLAGFGYPLQFLVFFVVSMALTVASRTIFTKYFVRKELEGGFKTA